MPITWESALVTELQPHEVFVFGSNESGFHGAGAAGLAYRGDHRNNWRTDEAFVSDLTVSMGGTTRHLSVPVMGRWAVLGVGRGPQTGSLGRSYAVATVTKPGARCSVSRREIYHQLVALWQYARTLPDRTFLITPLGEGYAGWTEAEMAEVWGYLTAKHGLPENLRFIGRRAGVSAT
jgi:hypothetical protein